MNAISKTNHIYDYLEQTEFDENRYNVLKMKISRYKLAKWLIEDYSINGIFNIKEKRQSRYKGKINWSRTINSTLPIMAGEDSIYVNPIRKYANYNDQLLLSDIHRTAVVEAYDFLKSIGYKNNISLPEINSAMLGKLDRYASVVAKYQNIVFSDRDIKVLRSLTAWCTFQSKYYEKPIGTVSFELVWEDLLRNAFGNLPKGLSFGAPEYRLGVDDHGNEMKQVINNDSIPDIINIFEDKDDGRAKFLLLDAKYYVGKIPSRDNNKKREPLKQGYQWIEGVPGYKDIAKQFDYFATLCDEYGLSDGVNVFVMPWYEFEGIECYPANKNDVDQPKWVRYLGYAYKGDIDTSADSIVKKMKELGFDNMERKSSGKKVLVIQIDPEWLFSKNSESLELANENASKLWKYLLQYK
jgi:hypothetical protein